MVGSGDLIGKTAGEALPELTKQRLIGPLRQAYESGRTLILRGYMVKVRAQPAHPLEPRFLDFVYQPIIHGTEVTGLLVVGQDVTDNLLAEERARTLRDQLHFSSRLKAMGTVALTLAHELNQPLTAIQNYAAGGRTMLDEGKTDLEMLDDALKAIGENAQRAGLVIRRLCEMTESGMVRKEVFGLEEAVREAADLAKSGDCETVGLRYDFAPGAQASADRIQVQQVLFNLIRNACEACVQVKCPEVCIATVHRSEWLEVRVTDSGEGLSGDALLTLFEPFISSKPEGMGLGLSISRTLVESQGGRIWAENAPGGGAVFCFTIPSAVAVGSS